MGDPVSAIMTAVKFIGTWAAAHPGATVRAIKGASDGGLEGFGRAIGGEVLGDFAGNAAARVSENVFGAPSAISQAINGMIDQNVTGLANEALAPDAPSMPAMSGPDASFNQSPRAGPIAAASPGLPIANSTAPQIYPWVKRGAAA